MGLTRPTVAQLNTVVTEISDPISVLNKGSTLANVDVGFVFNRDGGASPNVAFYWNETIDSLVVAYTTSTGGVNSNIAITSYANLQVGNITSAGNISAQYIIGNGQFLSSLPGYAYSNVNVGAYLSTSNYLTSTSANLSNYAYASNVTTANTAMKGYVDNAVSTANIGMKGYVDSVASQSIYGNSNVASYLPTYSGVVGASNVFVSGNVTAQYVLGSGQFLTGLPAGYSNVNVKAYTESMGFANYSNVNVAALITTNGLTNYSNVNAKAYTESMGFANYSNVNVAALITTNGLTNYSNVNAKAYTESMGFQNYGNVNVAALITTNGLTNYSNVNVKAYTESMGFQNFSNVNVAAYLSSGLASSLNTSGNLLSTGLRVFGNTSIGLIGAISGQFHTVVGNITQSTSGGSVYFNTAGNILATGGIFNALTVNGTTTSTGFINTSGNISTAQLNAGQINTTGNVLATGGIFNLFRVNHQLGGGNSSSFSDSVSTQATSNQTLRVIGGNQYVFFNANLGAGSYNSFVSGNDVGIIFSGLAGQGSGNLVIAPWSVSQAGIRIVGTTGLVQIPGQLTINANNSPTAIALGGTAGVGNIGVSGAPFNTAFLTTLNATGNVVATTGVFNNVIVNTGNVNAVGGYFIGSGQFLTGLPAGYSNVNVKAYTESMGFANYSNVNVAAYTQTQSYTNYSNVNLAAYLGGAVTIGGNLTVQGNLFVNGNLTTINANNLNIADSMIYLADNNPADTLDIGFVSAFTSAVRYQHTGLVRDATDGVWKLFANVVSEPTTTIDFTNATYSNLQIGNVTAQTANISEVRISQGNITINPGPVSSVLRILNAYGGGFQIDGGGPRLGLGTLANIFSFFDVYSINNNNHINSSNRPLIIGFSTGGAGGNVLYMDPRWGNTVLNTNSQSTSTTTGAFVVTGGVGIGGNLNVGGNLAIQGTVQGNLTVTGNISAENINFTGNIIHADSGDPVGYIRYLDDIEHQFDGSTKKFLITYDDGIPYDVNNPLQLQIYVGGIIVPPTRYIRDYHNLPEVAVFDHGFYLQKGLNDANAVVISTVTTSTGNVQVSSGGNTIVFATAPSSSMDFQAFVRTNSDPQPAFKFKQTPFTALNIMLGP